MSSDAKGPNLYLFVLIYFMGIRGESVQLGKLWARNGVTTTNHHSEPGLFFNRGLSGFLSVSKGSWHLHDRLSSALKGSSLSPQLAEVLTSSSSIYRGQTFKCTQLWDWLLSALFSLSFEHAWSLTGGHQCGLSVIVFLSSTVQSCILCIMCMKLFPFGILNFWIF